MPAVDELQAVAARVREEGRKEGFEQAKRELQATPALRVLYRIIGDLLANAAGRVEQRDAPGATVLRDCATKVQALVDRPG